jgi:hypothetical protein
MAKLESVSPISNEDTQALPVKNLRAAIAYYETVVTTPPAGSRRLR